MVQLTIGLQLGGETFSEIVTFEDRAALDRFKSGRTTFAASASAVLVKAGAAASARPGRGTTAYVAADGGMMLEAAIGGQKFFFKPAVLGRMKSCAAAAETFDHRQETSRQWRPKAKAGEAGPGEEQLAGETTRASTRPMKPNAPFRTVDTPPEHLLAPVAGTRPGDVPWSDNDRRITRRRPVLGVHQLQPQGSAVGRLAAPVAGDLSGAPAAGGPARRGTESCPRGCSRSSATGRSCPSRRTSGRTSTRRTARVAVPDRDLLAAVGRVTLGERGGALLQAPGAGRPDPALIVEGEPNASDGKPGVPPDDECFPEAMRFHIGETGELSARCAEPIAADARDGKDGRDNARLKLLAGLLGVNYDALKRRDERRRRARRLLAAGIGLVIAVLLAGQWAWQERAKTGALSRQLASAYRERAERFVEKADDVDAALYFAQSNALSPGRTTAMRALLRLQELVAAAGVFEHGTAIETVAFAPDGRRLLTAGDGGRVRVWDAGSGGLSPNSAWTWTRTCSSGRRSRWTESASSRRRKTRGCGNAQTGRPLTPAIPFKTVTSTGKDLSGSTVSESIYVDCAGLDPDERQVVLHWNEEGYVQFWDANSGQPAGDRATYADSLVRLAFLWDSDPIPRFSPDRRISVFSDYFQPLQLTDLKTNKRIPGTPRHDGVITAAAFSPDSRVIVTGGSEGTARVWDAATGLPRRRRCGSRARCR